MRRRRIPVAMPGAAARLLGGAVSAAGAPPATLTRPLAAALGMLARRLAASREPERRALAPLLDAAVARGDAPAAFRLVRTAARGPDRRAEKILSRRYRFLWICNPKAASRSLIAALRAADPAAVPIRGRTLEQVYARYPEARGYFSFAFVRHPLARTRSFYEDKHALAGRDRNAYRWFIEPYHGLRLGMSFAEVCRWLLTPCGADAFADRHWLSQSRQIATVDGRAPDFLGRFERLDADWRAVAERLGLPPAPLPRLNPSPRRGAAAPGLEDGGGDDAELGALLRRRYAEDFALGGYGDAP